MLLMGNETKDAKTVDEEVTTVLGYMGRDNAECKSNDNNKQKENGAWEAILVALERMQTRRLPQLRNSLHRMKLFWHGHP